MQRRSFLIVPLALVSAALLDPVPAGSADGWYQPGAGWLETVVASRQRMRDEVGSVAGLEAGTWFSSGPFGGPEGTVFARAYPPESVRFDAAARNGDGALVWSARPEWVDGGVIPLPDVEHAAFYVTRTLTVRSAMRLPVWLGSDDGLAVWLNGRRILSRDVRGACAPDQVRVDLDLRRGANRLLMKITNGTLQAGFYFAMEPGLEALNREREGVLRERLLAGFPEARGEIRVAGEDGVLGTGAVTRSYDHPGLEVGDGWQPDAIGSGETTWGWRSKQAGARITFQFIGTEVSLLHRTSPEYPLLLGSGRACGQVAVAIDGRPAGVVDTSLNTGRTLLARGLKPGPHKLTVTNLGRGADPARNEATVIVGGFAVDTATDNEAVRLAGRIAERVVGGGAWRQGAAELAAVAEGPDDLGELWSLYLAARELEPLARRLRAVQARPPPSRFVAEERETWVPDGDARSYEDRLAGLAGRLAPLVQRAETFQFESGGRRRFEGLLAAVREGVDEVETFFAAEGRRLPPIVFFTGSPLQSGAAPNHVWQSEPRGPWGCSIRCWDPGQPGVPARILWEDPRAILFDLTVAPDARTVLFSMRRQGERYWQIHEMGVDGSGLRQLTSGEHHNVGPVPLPDGRLAFLSSRTRGYHTVCQSGPSMHVHVMDRDGSGARDLSNNTLTDFGLGILGDGRLLFTRWEYVDVNLTYRQSLWTQQPDGRRYQLYFGNTIVDPATFWQAREIPGRDAVVCTFTSHHHTPHGAIGLVSPHAGREAPRDVGYRWITREFPSVVDLDLFWAYRDPYPVAQNRFLVSYGGGGLERFRICLLDEMDNRTTLYDDPETSCFYPQPLRVRPEPARLPAGRPDEPVAGIRVPAAPPGQPVGETVALGRLLVADVYEGLGAAVVRGRAKSIRIMEQLPKTVNRTWYTMNDQGPLMGAGTYYAKRVWGYAPVEADGSAHFEAPAGKEIYLQVCDEEGRELQRMTSAIQLMPGETQGCIGCHEGRARTPPPGPSLAARRPPTRLVLPQWGHAGVLDYPRVVQPVLDRHCVRCHEGQDPDGGVLLTGNFTRYYNMSYEHLVNHTQSDARSKAFHQGLSDEKPMVQVAHLLVGTATAYRPLQSGSLASRLPEYFTRAHCGREVPAADRRIIHEWIDAMAPYYGTQDYARRGACGNRDKWGDPETRGLLPWFTDQFGPVYDQRCASCHGGRDGRGLPHERQWSWIDLSDPRSSPALAAHLAKSAGGRGIPAGEAVFRDTADPGYQRMLRAITEGAAMARQVPEADMPGFAPVPDAAYP